MGNTVPNSKDHVIYVWLDALVNYLSALDFSDEKDELYKKFWLHQFISLEKIF